MNGAIRPQTLRLNNNRLDVQMEQCTIFKQSQVYLQLVSEGEDYVKFFTVQKSETKITASVLIKKINLFVFSPVCCLEKESSWKIRGLVLSY